MSIPASLLINGTACGIKFYQEHGKIERDHILLQQAHLENQLKLLQDQINPHVMFNILNHIHILMKSNTELASFLFIKIFRYTSLPTLSLQSEFGSIRQRNSVSTGFSRGRKTKVGK